MNTWIQIAYLISTALFIFSLKWMNDPKTARRGVIAGVAAMLVAVIGTLINPAMIASNYKWIALAIVIGSVIGVPLSWVPLTAVPQRTALSHAFGGLAAGLVGVAEFYLSFSESGHELSHFRAAALCAEVLLGFLTFTGSLMAAGKLQEIIPTRPITYKGQNIINLSLLTIAIVGCIVLSIDTNYRFIFPIIIFLALLFGVQLILPIGGADMPTLISILNSYAGLSAVAMGFVMGNKLLITAGALDGSSGLILSIIMCKAMNRSFTNVLFGAFGKIQVAGGDASKKTVKSATPEEAGQIMEQAGTVVIVPGYGMAVAQAQHRVRELYDQLTNRGITVKFAIHPVAGRMPGHMNVLLAEADIPYTDLVEMDDINPEMPQVDVVLVIGANDVVNPAARTNKSSPIYGMPIIDADKAKMVLAIKRSMNPGFAGIENELYYADKTLMVFGDAKAVVGDLVKYLSGEAVPEVTEEDLIRQYSVKEVMDTNPVTLREDLSLDAILDALGKSDSLYYPVVDEQLLLKGIITVSGIKETFAQRDVALGWLLACDIAQPADDKTTWNTPLAKAMEHMKKFDLEYMPVVSGDDNKLVGAIDARAVNRRISAEVLRKRRGR
jgi:NAD(P) transhydrogenase subunit beta